MSILKRPLITEKATKIGESLHQYGFLVDIRANKIQIKDAVQVIFDVTVLKVRTMIQPAKRGRRGRAWYVRSKEWKKAVVTLAEGDEIDLFNP